MWKFFFQKVKFNYKANKVPIVSSEVGFARIFWLMYYLYEDVNFFCVAKNSHEQFMIMSLSNFSTFLF